MVKQKIQLLAFFVLNLSVSPFVYATEFADLLKGPFYWQTKPGVHKKVFEEHVITVSAQKENDKEFENWTFRGAGLVRVPMAQIGKNLFQFQLLEGASRFVDKVIWKPETGELTVVIRLPPLAAFSQKFLLEDHLKDDISHLRVTALNGYFAGAKGVLFLKDYKRQSVEMGLHVVDQVPLKESSVLIRPFMIEVVMQYVATSMRNQLEKP